MPTDMEAASINEDIPVHDSRSDAPSTSSSTHLKENQVPPLSGVRKQALSEAEEAKVQLIINATESRDYQALSELASSSGGLIDDEVRRVVCTLRPSDLNNGTINDHQQGPSF